MTTFEKKMYATFIKGEGNKGPTMYGARSLSPSPGDMASDGAEENLHFYFFFLLVFLEK